MTRRSWIVSIVLCSSLIVGCAAWRPAPTTLPFPVAPQLHAIPGTDGDDGYLCLSRDTAIALAKWLDKIEAFKHAYERQGR